MSSNMKVPFASPYITREDKESVMRALDSPWLTCGQNTLDFERLFSRYVGVKHAISVNSGTAALHLAMRAVGIGSGDEVIVPTMTFAATANAAIFCGARPVFADVDEQTLNISPESIEAQITPRTKAVVPVHIGGVPCDMPQIFSIAIDHNLCVIEDCAHSLGARFGAPTGSLCDVGAFSGYPTKPICLGEGGVATTNNDDLAEKMRLMRSHYMTKESYERQCSSSWKYDIAGLGYNYRLDEMSAALGVSQLVKVERMRMRRQKIHKYYSERLSKVKGIRVPFIPDDRISSYHLYVVRVDEKDYGMSRNSLFAKLAERSIQCSVHFTPLHLFSYYAREFGSKEGDCPIAEKAYGQILSLPIFAGMWHWQMEYVVNSIKELAR